MPETLSLFNDPSANEEASRPPFPIPVTATLIALNVLVYLAMVVKGVSPLSPTAQQVLPWGANFGPLTFAGQWWRIVTACFLHFGIIHLAMNMYILFQIGLFTEVVFGKVRFILLYALCGLGGSLASLYIHPLTTSAGASGAIFGLYGALLGFLLVARGILPKDNALQILKSAGLFIGYNLIFGLADGKTDLSAHIGGLLTGFLAGSILARPHSKRAGALPLARTIATAVVGIAVIVAGFRYVGRTSKAEDDRARLYLGTSVPLANGGRVIYSGSATRAEAQALAQSLVSVGLGGRSGAVYLFSKDATGPTISIAVGQDESTYAPHHFQTSELVDGKNVIKASDTPAQPFPWDDLRFVNAFKAMGIAVAPAVGGPPLSVRLLNTNGELRKTLHIDTHDQVVGINDHIWYSGSATQQEAQALGKSLRSLGYFQNQHMLMQFTRSNTGTELFFPVSGKTWDEPEVGAVFHSLTRQVAKSVGGLPITTHLCDSSFEPKKSFLVQ